MLCWVYQRILTERVLTERILTEGRALTNRILTETKNHQIHEYLVFEGGRDTILCCPAKYMYAWHGVRCLEGGALVPWCSGGGAQLPRAVPYCPAGHWGTVWVP